MNEYYGRVLQNAASEPNRDGLYDRALHTGTT